jgi:tetratricopeptide (TPR) repeat protein
MRRAFQTDTIQEQERDKSTFLLQAKLAKDMGKPDEAVPLFARAAQLEEELAAAYDEQGIAEQVWRHQFSAASCWSQAGNFLRAIELCDLLTASEAPMTLRERAAAYAQTVRERREHLWAEIRQAERQLAAA